MQYIYLRVLFAMANSAVFYRDDSVLHKQLFNYILQH